MERAIIDITLDLAQSHSGNSVTVKRGDTHRTLRIHLSNGGKPYSVDPKCQAIFTAVKPDGSHIFNSCRVEEQRIVYDLTPQTTALSGMLECELRLYGSEGALLTSAAFMMTVSDTVYADGDENVVSTGEATALTKLLSDAGEKLLQMENALENQVNHATINDTAVGDDAWSSRKIAETFCPGFAAEGAVAVCEPLEGYPLEVVSTIADKGSAWDSITLKRCGKNLFDFKQPVSRITYNTANGQGSRWGYAFILPAGTYTMHAERMGTNKDQYIYCVLNDLSGVPVSVDGFGMLKQGVSYWTRTFTLSELTVLFVYDGLSGDSEQKAQALFSDDHNVQIELGSVATAYEPYRGQTLTTEIPWMEEGGDVMFGSYNWQTGVLDTGEHGIFQHNPEANTFTLIDDPQTYVPPIVRKLPALPGTNCLWSDCGNTAVTGVADPVGIIEKLTNAVIALGGNI